MTSFLHIPDAMTAPDAWPPATPLALVTKYEPDPFQKHAILAIEAGDHVFVTAKTGSGKTFVGEYLIAKALKEGNRAFYTAPIKSLVNQKYKDLKALFPDATVGILTGDIKMCPDAQIIIMTAEILRNLFYKRGTATEGVGATATVSLNGVSAIVIDEAHYIQDPDRGHVWEETLILCPRFAIGLDGLPTEKPLSLVLLSATLPSADLLAGWLANLHQRRTWLLSTTYRIVPLVHAVLSPSDAEEHKGYVVRPLLDAGGRWILDAYTGWLKDRASVAAAALQHKKAVANRKAEGFTAPPPTGKVRVMDPVARLISTVEWLDQTKQMPALFFVFSRAKCEQLAGLVQGSLLTGGESSEVRHIFDFHLSRHRKELEASPTYHTISDLVKKGIAFHHSGLQPLLKEIVEILFTRGFIKVLFATETFSVGLNMPTKTVVFTALTKMSDGGIRRLRTDEYLQMAGRAGRRGLDTQGLVLYAPMDDPLDPIELKGLLTGSLPPLQSRMRFHYDFILKHHLTGSKLQIAEQSYWAVQQGVARAGLDKEIAKATIEAEAAAAKVLPEEEAMVAEYDVIVAECNAKKNAAWRKARTALDVWTNERPGLPAAQVRVTTKTAAAVQLRRLKRGAEEWDAAPLLAIAPQEALLESWGFLTADKTLTLLGVTASEVNEGHNILMPWLAASGLVSDLTGAEIACIVAGFLQEGGESQARIDSSSLRQEALRVLYAIDDQARIFQRAEDMAKARSPEEFWDLSPLWVCVTDRWLAGASIPQIAAEFELFEGNVQRGLMRVGNLLDEWTSIATLRKDLTTLEKLGELRFTVPGGDSLYLRL